MNTLVVDVGGTNVKILATGQTEPRKFPSGPELIDVSGGAISIRHGNASSDGSVFPAGSIART